MSTLKIPGCPQGLTLLVRDNLNAPSWNRYPAFRSQSLNVSKHVAVLSELARLVEVYHLLDVSQFEQELACADDHVAHYRELMEKLTSTRYCWIGEKFRFCRQ